MSAPTASGDATPIVSARTRTSGGSLGDSGRDLLDSRGIDLALEGAAEGDAQDHGRATPVRSCSLDDRPGDGNRLLDRGSLISPVELLGHPEREAHLVEPGRDQSVVAALVEGQTRPRHAGQRPDGRHHSLGVCHLGHAARIDEARDLDGGKPGRGQPAHELRPGRDVEDVRLVLQPVARADLDQRHARHTRHSSHPSVVA